MEKGLDDLISAVAGRITELGFDLVDVRQRGSRQRTVLQVRVDRLNSAPGRGITAEDCASVSRALEAWLDESEVLGDRYVLEVSSPGIERPVRWPRHWKQYVGHDVRVRVPTLGKRRVRATIVRVDDDESVVLRLNKDKSEMAVALTETLDATLVVDWSTVDGSSERTSRKESQ